MIKTREIRHDENGKVIYERYKIGTPLEHICITDRDENQKIIHFKDSRGLEYWKERNEDGKVIHFKQEVTGDYFKDLKVENIEWWKTIRFNIEENEKIIKYKDSNNKTYIKTIYENGNVLKTYGSGAIKKYELFNGELFLFYHKTKNNKVKVDYKNNRKDKIMQILVNGKIHREITYDDNVRIIRDKYKGQVTEYNYDINSDVFKTVKHRDGSIVKYDGNLNVIYRLKNNGREFYYKYDSNNRLIYSKGPDSINEKKYNENGRLIYRRDGNRIEELEYDENDILRSIIDYKIIEDK